MADEKIETLDYLPTQFQYDYKNKSIKIFYRIKDDNNLYMKSEPFKHYIYVASNKSMSKASKEYMLLNDYNTKYVKQYFDPQQARTLYMENYKRTAEGDLSPERRYISDNLCYVKYPDDIKPRVYYIDIETYSHDGFLPKFNHNIAEINAITLYDSYEDKYYSWFVIPKKLLNDNIGALEKSILESVKTYNINVEIMLFDTYKSLLGNFRKFLMLNTPDIITAYNSSFDIPYIVRKIYDHFGEDGLYKLSPFKRISSKVKQALETGLGLEMDSIIPGISVIDYLLLYKSNAPQELASNTLDYVSKLELGEGKVEYSSDDPITLYDKDFICFCKYNIQDVRLIKEIDDKKKLINYVIAMRNITKSNYDDIFKESVLIDNYQLMKIVKWRDEGLDYVLPSRPLNTIKKDLLGAYVKETVVGRHKWISDLDFTSLYPNIIRNFKLSIETCVGKILNHQDLITYLLYLYYKDDDKKISNIDYINFNFMPRWKNLNTELYKNGKFDINIEFSLNYNNHKGLVFSDANTFIDWCKSNNYLIMGNGLIIDYNTNKAFLAEIVSELMETRTKYNKLKEKYELEGNDFYVNIYDRYQNSTKKINNSVYGVCAQKDFRLHQIDIAEGITSTGQILIKSSTYKLNKYMNEELNNSTKKDYCITNDTDSIIFTLQDYFYDLDPNEENLENYKKVETKSKQLQDYINGQIPNIMKNVFFKDDNMKNTLSLKSEWVATSGLFVAKKCYAIKIVFEKNLMKNFVKMVGLTIKKSSMPKAMQGFFNKILDKILKFEDKKIIDNMILNEIENIKNKYNIKDLAFPTSIKPLEYYTKNLPIHVRGAKVFNEYYAKNEKDKIVSGKIRYILVKKWNINKLNESGEYVLSIPVNSLLWDNIDKLVKIDDIKMKERLLVKVTESFYGALGWEAPKQLYMKKSSTTFTFLNKKG